MPRKTLIVIHGRSEKPKESTKLRLVRMALSHGLGRVGASLDGINLKLAYYGDINNLVLKARAAGNPITAKILESSRVPYEPDDKYDEPLRKLFSIGTDHQERKSFYRQFVRSVPDNNLADNLFDIVAPVLNLVGLGDNVLNRVLPDLGAYFNYRVFGSRVRARLQKVLVPALQRDDDVCLVAHSMGSIVAYDVLWKLSRMGEYTHLHDKKLTKFITIGSPLGETAIKKQLYDRGEPDDGMYPANITRWENFSAHDDAVSHDEDLRDDFREMERRKLVKVADYRCRTYYVGGGGSHNPHKLYGYLDNRKVAASIAKWAEST